MQPEEEDAEVHRGLVLSLTLKSSMYATMALREVTRTDTGKAAQRTFTRDHSAKNKEQNGAAKEENGAAKGSAVDDIQEENGAAKRAAGDAEVDEVPAAKKSKADE